MRKVHIANDHAAKDLKPVLLNWLIKQGFEIVDHGSSGTESVDYPDHAHLLADAVERGAAEGEVGILICGSANGVSMSANKHKGVRAAICWRPEIAELARQHNDANVICLPARFMAISEAQEAVRVFLNTPFEGGRHARRVNKIACGVLVLLMALVSPPWAQVLGQEEAPAPATSDQYSPLIDTEDLKTNLYFLASDAMEGRETGTRGAKMAAEYIAEKFETFGLEPVQGSFFQGVPLRTSQINGGHMRFGDYHGHFLENFMPSMGVSTREILDANPIFVGYGIQESQWDDYQGLDVKGHVVVMLSGVPEGQLLEAEWDKNFQLKRELAESLGATAVVINMPDFDVMAPRYKQWLTRERMRLNTDREGEGATIPVFYVSNELITAGTGPLKRVKKRLSKGKGRGAMDGPIHIEIELTNREFESENVWGALRGRDEDLADEWVVISCHYDHVGVTDGEVYNGADDDGSGTVSLIECAEAWTAAAADGQGPRRSVLFIAFVGEEKGLLGSDWYTSNPAVPMERTVCDLNIDMVGRTDAEHPDSDRYVYLIGSDKLSSSLHEISESCNEEFTKLALDYTFNAPDDPNRYYYRSDHYNFAKHDVPVIFYFSGVHEDYHGPGDTPDKIHYEKLAEIGQLVFHTSWEVANRDKRLVIDATNDFPVDR